MHEFPLDKKSTVQETHIKKQTIHEFPMFPMKFQQILPSFIQSMLQDCFPQKMVLFNLTIKMSLEYCFKLWKSGSIPVRMLSCTSCLSMLVLFLNKGKLQDILFPPKKIVLFHWMRITLEYSFKLWELGSIPIRILSCTYCPSLLVLFLVL